MCINVCIQNLGMYNEGMLKFKWLELPASEEELNQAFNDINVSYIDSEGEEHIYHSVYGAQYGVYEEYMLADWECDIDGLEIGEYSNLFDLNQKAQIIEDLSDSEREIVAARMEAFNESLEQAIANIDDTIFYQMSLDDLSDMLADEYIESLTYNNKAAEELAQYFDYDKFKDTIEYDYTETATGCIYNH